MVWGREIKIEGKKMGEIKIAREKREIKRKERRDREGYKREREGEMRGI